MHVHCTGVTVRSGTTFRWLRFHLSFQCPIHSAWIAVNLAELACCDLGQSQPNVVTDLIVVDPVGSRLVFDKRLPRSAFSAHLANLFECGRDVSLG